MTHNRLKMVLLAICFILALCALIFGIIIHAKAWIVGGAFVCVLSLSGLLAHANKSFE